MPGQYELFEDDEEAVRWRLRAANGEIIAQSEGYSSMTAALNGIEAVRENAGSEVQDLTR